VDLADPDDLFGELDDVDADTAAAEGECIYEISPGSRS